MSKTDEYYNIFNPEGKLLQIEYCLEALHQCRPFVVLSSPTKIVAVSKKPPTNKLSPPSKTTFKINSSVYATITGLPGDIDQIKYRLIDLAQNNEYNYGFELSADIIAHLFSDKLQHFIQTTGTRMESFGVVIYGFEDEKVHCYYTDSSAILVPMYGTGVGEQSTKINNFLEKNRSGELEELAVEGMCQTLGYDFGPNEVDICVLWKGKELVWMDSVEIDNILVKISEKN